MDKTVPSLFLVVCHDSLDSLYNMSSDKGKLQAAIIKRVVVGTHLFYSTKCLQIKENYGPNLDNLQVGQTVGVLVDEDHNLHLYVDGVDQGVAARDVPSPCYGMLDLYGQCELVSRLLLREIILKVYVNNI